MFRSESNFDKKSGLLRSGKRYKRNLESYTLGHNNEYTPENPESEVTLARVFLSQVTLLH